MKHFLSGVLAAGCFAYSTSIYAERYVMITHTQGTDTFWPVVEKGGRDAARAVGADFEYNYDVTGDMAGMASLIEAAAEGQPDGLIVSLPDPDALGPAIESAIENGIPVVTINSGLEASASLGALMHVGQPDRLAGEKAGQRARREGVTNGMCVNNESFNSALVSRCEGYFSGLGTAFNMIDASSDVAQMQTRTAAALQANESIDGILAISPEVCEAVNEAIKEAGRAIHLACFDLTPGTINMIEKGEASFSIDQQQRLQGYMAVVVLHLYNNSAGLLPGANIPSGPGFVDKSNVASVKETAGVDR